MIRQKKTKPALWTIGKKKPKTNRQIYFEVAKRWLKKHARCEAAVAPGRTCSGFSRDVHHKRGRNGTLLIDTRFFLAVCRPCHNSIHDPRLKDWHLEAGNLDVWGIVPWDGESIRLRIVLRGRETI